jgi:hypothetical protein
MEDTLYLLSLQAIHFIVPFFLLALNPKSFGSGVTPNLTSLSEQKGDVPKKNQGVNKTLPSEREVYVPV